MHFSYKFQSHSIKIEDFKVNHNNPGDSIGTKGGGVIMSYILQEDLYYIMTLGLMSQFQSN